MEPQMAQVSGETLNNWQGIISIITAPVGWILSLQKLLFTFIFQSDFIALHILKPIFLLMPITVVVVGLWCTTAALYTIIFRSERVQLIGTFLVLWWDIGRCTWLFWAGMARFLLVAFGAIFGFLRLAVAIVLELVREIASLPFVVTGALTQNLRQPGVPWIAFLLTVIWSGLEAVIFSYVLTPTFSEVISDLVGTESHTYMTPILFVVLFFMIMGSFACVQALVDAVKEKDIRQIIQMMVVEVVVMMVEVVFLYRELIDSITPWIAQQTGLQMGVVTVLVFASSAWVGVRAMVWFLFGRYGTPTLLAFISRQRLMDEGGGRRENAEATRQWDTMIDKLKKEQEWFLKKAQDLLEAAILPVFQIIAVGLNFAVALFMAHPLFILPFKSLADVKDTRSLIESMFSGKGSR